MRRPPNARNARWLRLIAGLWLVTLATAVASGLLPAPAETFDPVRNVRAVIIASGLLLGVAAPLLAVGIREAEAERSWNLWSIALASWLLGWVCIPVWANGLLAASDRALVDWLSVHRLMPYVWLGRGYAYAVFVGLPLSACYACAFILNAGRALWTGRAWVSALTWLTLPVTFALTWNTAALCLVWLFD